MGRYQPGQSGNPRGRPPGVADRRTALRSLLEPHAETLVAKAVALAASGDVQALALCLSRLIPPARSAPVSLPGFAGTLADQGRQVLDALAAGRLTPDEATQVMGAVAAQARIVEVADLERRIAALETKNANAQGANRAA